MCEDPLAMEADFLLSRELNSISDSETDTLLSFPRKNWYLEIIRIIRIGRDIEKE